MSNGLFEVRERVLGLARDGRTQNALVRASRGPDRAAAREAKRGVGRAARVYLLAYAMLRGIPYDRLERSSRTPPWMMGRILDEVSGIVRQHRPDAGDGAVSEWFRTVSS